MQRRARETTTTPETINGIFNSSLVRYDQNGERQQKKRNIATKRTSSLFYINGGTPYQSRVVKDCLTDLVTTSSAITEGSFPPKEDAERYLETTRELFDFLAITDNKQSPLQVWCFKKIYLKTLDHLGTYFKKEGEINRANGSVHIDPATQEIFFPEDQKVRVVLQ